MIGTTLLNYRIAEKLGAGGQGAVYKAIDTRLGRTIVIKVLAPELTAKETNLKRFEREAQLASSLDHPNICTIYGLHELDGVHFITMQYVEGRNVRELVNGKPLQLTSALSIGIQVTDALAAAHARGIIHRDIKAGNVMVTNTGLVKVLDFGLAKLLDESGSGKGDMHLTELGVPYGTATYAAPEQATGQKVDHRADIFSTGVLLYEMLAGTWPFRGKSSVEVRYAVLHDAPKPLGETRSDIDTTRLQGILDRALAKEPSARYQKVAELRDDLKDLMVNMNPEGASQVNRMYPGGVPPVVPRHQSGSPAFGRTLRRWLRSLAGSEATPTSIPPAPTRNPGSADAVTAPVAGNSLAPAEVHETHLTSQPGIAQTSVAILPFRNLNNDPEVSFYEFSLADAVITDLACLRSLVVRPSSLIAKYQGQAVDAREVGRELSVSAVLSSSFLRMDKRLRVTSQLLDVSRGEILWSDRIDADAQDIFTVQDTIARRIVDGLRLELSPDEQGGIGHRPTRNAQAYDEYLRGRDAHGRFIYHTLAREDSDEAIKHFERAIELDPSFALAQAALGGAYTNRVFKGFGDAEDYNLAEAAFDKALALDPQLLEARMHMVFIYLARGEKKKAHAWIEILREEAPNDTGVHFVLGTLYRLEGHFDRALREFDTMLRLNPAERLVVSYNRARLFMYQNRNDEALHELEQGRAIEPDHPLTKAFHAVALFRRGDYPTATNMLREVLERHPRMDGIRPLLAQSLSAQGEHEAARAQLTEGVFENAAVDHDIAYWLASAYAMEGEREQAYEWLERSIKLGNENRPWFETNPVWEPLRNEPRFRELMEGIGTDSL